MVKARTLLTAVALSALVSVASAAEWRDISTTDPLTDEVMAAFATSSTLPAQYAPRWKPMLIIGCAGTGWNAGVAFGPRGVDYPAVDYRIDARPPQRFRSAAKTDFMLFERKASAWVEELSSGTSLYVRGNDFLGRSMEARFSLEGIDEALARLSPRCPLP